MSKIARVIEVGSARTIDDVLRQSNTDWDIEVLTASTAEKGINSGGFKALVRPDTGTALAYVGSRFRPNNHREQLHALELFVTNGDIVPVSVSTWDDGALLAYQFRCPGLDVVIRDRDVVSPLLTLAFAYGSQLADTAFFSDFRWFCRNQMGMVAPLTKGNRAQHRGTILTTFADIVGKRLGELGGELSGRYDGMRRMTQAPLVGRALHNYFGEAIGAKPEEIEQAWVMPAEDLRGTSAKLPEILECYQADDAGAAGTVWHAYNAVTRFETHKDGRSVETRTRRMLLGDGSNVANRAGTLAAQLAA